MNNLYDIINYLEKNITYSDITLLNHKTITRIEDIRENGTGKYYLNCFEKYTQNQDSVSKFVRYKNDVLCFSNIMDMVVFVCRVLQRKVLDQPIRLVELINQYEKKS